ncbi:hypothetical protein Q1695_005041 [Nippostrongylus brasiliensis]|nr:hypothetical protein Q1695_005041 [Nippostrongylus brasiliensis]
MSTSEVEVDVAHVGLNSTNSTEAVTSRTTLDPFISQAMEMNFPLQFSPADCALRGYGAFVLWMHLVVYLILKYVNKEIGEHDKVRILFEGMPTSPPKATPDKVEVAAKAPMIKASKEQSGGSHSSTKRSTKKKNKALKGSTRPKKHTFEETESEDGESEESDDQITIDKTVDAGWDQWLAEDRLALMKEFLATYDSKRASAEPVPKVPAWTTTYHVRKSDDADAEQRRLMRNWLFVHQSSAKTVRARSATVSQRKEQLSKEQLLGEQKSLKEKTQQEKSSRERAETLLARAPKGYQEEMLNSMDKFMSKFGEPGEKVSTAQDRSVRVIDSRTAESKDKAQSIHDMIEPPFVATSTGKDQEKEPIEETYVEPKMRPWF